MITKEELSRICNITGLNLGQQEKEYIQQIFLYFLYQVASKEIVFKGGTALAMIHNLNRFSEELNFTSLEDKERTEKIVSKAIDKIKLFGINNEVTIKKSTTALSLRIRYEGPLYDGTERSKGSLRVEVSLRKDLILKTKSQMIIPKYPDIPAFSVVVMDEKEMLCEKLRALIVRKKPRDLYDVWFLLSKNVKLDITMLNKKLEIYNIRFSLKKMNESISTIQPRWERELKSLMKVVPDFENVKKFVIRSVRNA